MAERALPLRWRGRCGPPPPRADKSMRGASRASQRDSERSVLYLPAQTPCVGAKIMGMLRAAGSGIRRGNGRERNWRVIRVQCPCREGKLLRWDAWGGGCCRNPLGALAIQRRGVLVVRAGKLLGGMSSR